MRAPYSGKAGTDWRFGEGPFQFSGPPDQCVGEVELVNECEQKVKIRQLPITAPPRLKKGLQALDNAELHLEARIGVGQAGRFCARLALPASTAPGAYDASVRCGRSLARLRVSVEAQRALAISPSHFRLSGASGDTLGQSVHMDNLGNVPIAIAGGAKVWLRERNWIGRTLVYSLRDGTGNETYEAFANRLLHSFKTSLIPPATIRFSPKGGFQLAAGECVTRTLSLTLPEGLRKGRHYLGFIKIGGDRIWLELYCNGAPASGKRR